MVDEPAAASHSSPDEEDNAGADSEDSKSEHGGALQDPPVPPPGSSALAASVPTGGGAIPQATLAGAGAGAGAQTEESRRLFQRLWTDEEELLILRGFLEFTTRRGTTFASHQYDTAPFYKEIRGRLSCDFTKNQLIEKLRRLKKKYRVCASRMAAQGGAFTFKSAHEGAIHDLARHIWPPALKRDGAGGGDASDEDDINPAAATATAAAATATMPGTVEDGFNAPVPAAAPTPRGRRGRRVRRRTAQELEAPVLPALTLTDGAHQDTLVTVENSVLQIAQLPPVPISEPAPAPVVANGATEEAVRTILSPLLKEFISSVAVPGQNGSGLGLGMGFGVAGCDIAGLGFGIAGLNPSVPSVDKWRQQQILELEVYLKRIELVRDQVTAALEELRSSQGSCQKIEGENFDVQMK
ncbi:hypothetical protein GUJ93_ZPchr0008g11525 [Zizania palustris]|uniref:Glabrous enhancer-binding protein-like DBD domain-containing protein n=1 Tax=Zizania palustris TaxID=103762 RepID=A0A8J5QX26_ZIZPA|nr:hypothetical protein GUJ93_ZPchr0008g11525 [Zizania palustris]KAG8045547.1 hypothetical protein GUJ93_ZPchr0008g11525 [Zizania palustris]